MGNQTSVPSRLRSQQRNDQNQHQTLPHDRPKFPELERGAVNDHQNRQNAQGFDPVVFPSASKEKVLLSKDKEKSDAANANNVNNLNGPSTSPSTSVPRTRSKPFAQSPFSFARSSVHRAAFSSRNSFLSAQSDGGNSDQHQFPIKGNDNTDNNDKTVGFVGGGNGGNGGNGADNVNGLSYYPTTPYSAAYGGYKEQSANNRFLTSPSGEPPERMYRSRSSPNGSHGSYSYNSREEGSSNAGVFPTNSDGGYTNGYGLRLPISSNDTISTNAPDSPNSGNSSAFGASPDLTPRSYGGGDGRRNSRNSNMNMGNNGVVGGNNGHGNQSGALNEEQLSLHQQTFSSPGFVNTQAQQSKADNHNTSRAKRLARPTRAESRTENILILDNNGDVLSSRRLGESGMFQTTDDHTFNELLLLTGTNPHFRPRDRGDGCSPSSLSTGSDPGDYRGDLEGEFEFSDGEGYDVSGGYMTTRGGRGIHAVRGIHAKVAGTRDSRKMGGVFGSHSTSEGRDFRAGIGVSGRDVSKHSLSTAGSPRSGSCGEWMSDDGGERQEMVWWYGEESARPAEDKSGTAHSTALFQRLKTPFTRVVRRVGVGRAGVGHGGVHGAHHGYPHLRNHRLDSLESNSD